ncbi:MAG: putative transport system permease protein [Actinomycetota bacterium]|nr:putative transport system permease protein [Actinomycetota bacterium]
MFKVTWKGLIAHKLRFVLTGIAVILGVAFISGTFVFTATIQQTFDDLIANIYKGTDAQVRGPEAFKNNQGGPGATPRPPIPASVEKIVDTAPGVEAAQGNVQIEYAQLVDHKGKAIGNPGQGAPALGFGWNPVKQLNQFNLVPGGHPPRNADEIVIDKGSADKGHLHVGETVKVLTGLPPKDYKIVGIARFGTADNLAGASVVLFTLPEAQRIAGLPGQFDYIGIVGRAGLSQEEVAADVRTTLRQHGLGTLEVVTGKKLIDENQSQIGKALGFLNTGLLIFAFVALIVGAFIIYNTFSIVVAQRTREMALLRAIGASTRQVLGSIIGESLVIGVIASAIGVLGGIALAIGLRWVMSLLGIDLPGSGAVVPAKAVIWGMLVGTIVTLLSSIVPARNAARVPPVAALRDVAIEQPIRKGVRLGIGGGLGVLGVIALLSGLFAGAGIWFVILGAVLIFVGVFVLGPLYARFVSSVLGVPIARLKGITGTLARENAGRNPKRTSVTAAALMIGVALVGFITVFATSAKKSFLSTIDAQISSDYVINSGGSFGGTGLSPRLDREIAKLPAIDASTPVRVGPADVNKSVDLIAAVDPVPAQKLFALKSVGGKLSDLTPDGIAISKTSADKHHWKIGSTIPVKFAKTGNTRLRVEMIYDEKQLALPGGGNLISLQGYEKHFSQQLDALIFAKLKPGVSPEEGRKAIEPLLKGYPTAKLQDNAQYKADQVKNLNQLLGLIYGLLIFAVIIAFIGIANTLALSIHERTREIGLLRAVGESRRQVRSMIRWESVIISLLGTLLGLAIGLFFGWAVVVALHDQGITKFDPAVTTQILIVVIAGFSGIIAAILPARRAAKLDVLQSISSE